MACEIAAERVSQCVLQIIPDENAERCPTRTMQSVIVIKRMMRENINSVWIVLLKDMQVHKRISWNHRNNLRIVNILKLQQIIWLKYTRCN